MPKAGTQFDVIVIGTGSAGLSAAEAARDAGAKKVAVVEKRRRLGGECPNRGCIPTKALLRSTEVLALARRAKAFGLRIPETDFTFKAVMARKDAIVDRSTGGKRIEGILDQLGVALIRGKAVFTGPNTLKVGKTAYTAKKIIIATGSETFVPPIEGLDEVDFLTSDSVWDLKRRPKSLLIVGGGPIGVEFAEIFATLGTRVTIVEFSDRILPREDAEIAEIVRRSFEDRQRIAILTSSKVVKVAKKKGKVSATVESAGGEGRKRTLTADHVLVATGKRAKVGDLHLDAAGVETDDKGRVVLNDFLQTSNKDVYVAGDAASQMLFTHVAHYQGELAARNALKDNREKSDLSVVPRGTFCTPEVGSVGLTEAEAEKKGGKIGVGKAPYNMLGKASVMDEREGLVKIIVDKKSKKVLGGHVCGHAAAEIVHEIALAMHAGISYTVIADMIHAFPTFAEGVGAAAYNVE